MELKIIRKSEARVLEAQASKDLQQIKKLISENQNENGEDIDHRLAQRLAGDLKRVKRQQARFERIAAGGRRKKQQGLLSC